MAELLALMHGDARRIAQTFREGEALVGHAGALAVAQERDFVGNAFGQEHIAIGRHRHPARNGKPRGESGDREALRIAALDRLVAYQTARCRIGLEVPNSGRVAALHLAGSDGLPVIDEVHVVEGDVTPTHRQIAVPTGININVVVR